MKMTLRRLGRCLIAFFITLGVGSAVGSGFANAEGPSAKKMMRKMDTNGDGRIGRDEWLRPPRAFNRFDANKDGFLTSEEIDAVFNPRAATGPAIPWIDVHVHTPGGRNNPDFGSAVSDAAHAIEKSSMVKAVLMPTPQNGSANNWTLEDFINDAGGHPGRFALLGGGGTLNPMIHYDSPDGVVSPELKARFKRRAMAILGRGVAGFGEMSTLHVSHGPGHPFESVAADHPLFLLLADIAAEHDVVIDLHHDPVVEDMPTPPWLSQSENPPVLKKNIHQLKRLLEHNLKAKIVWAHAGSDHLGHWTLKLTRKMLTKHPNLYMSLRMGRGRGKEGRDFRNYPVGPGKIKPGWLKLFRDFPDRFVLGNDLFFTSSGRSGPSASFARGNDSKINNATAFLAMLPPDLARKIASENARRIYKLN